MATTLTVAPKRKGDFFHKKKLQKQNHLFKSYCEMSKKLIDKSEKKIFKKIFGKNLSEDFLETLSSISRSNFKAVGHCKNL